jgi:hypothetical protein
MASNRGLRSGIVCQGNITPAAPTRMGLTPHSTDLYSVPMRSDIHTGSRGFLRIPVFVLLLVYVSQVCPQVHLHHGHDDHGHPFELNPHPVKAHPEDLAAHEQNGHHHSFDEHVAWQRVRRLSGDLGKLTDLSSLCSGPHDEAFARQKFTGWFCDESILAESIPIAPFDPRGPPARA